MRRCPDFSGPKVSGGKACCITLHSYFRNKEAQSVCVMLQYIFTINFQLFKFIIAPYRGTPPITCQLSSCMMGIVGSSISGALLLLGTRSLDILASAALILTIIFFRDGNGGWSVSPLLLCKLKYLDNYWRIAKLLTFTFPSAVLCV